ncbi:MAG: hypothetical protein DMG01_14385 [Acidobacteria bacterium]|nr:MAG: hypothetical protein DMG01_14385 [Acidobacteriota bacterium]
MTVVAGRSKIATTLGIVAASQPLAARAGVQILERGGTASDAAIAANAVLGVVEPGSGVRIERERVGADRSHDLAAPIARPDVDAVDGCLYGDRARMRRRMGGVAIAVREPSNGRRARAGGVLRRRGISGVRHRRGAMGGLRRQARRRRERFGDVPRRRPRAARGRAVRESVARAIAAHDRSRRRSGILRRTDCRRDRRRAARARRHDDRLGSRRVQSRVGRPGLDDVPRLAGIRAAAEHARLCRAADARHHGAVSAA